MKPEPLGTVWTATARIRYIDYATMRWVTVSDCIDTPNAIVAALAKARQLHPGKTMWVHSDTEGKYIP